MSVKQQSFHSLSTARQVQFDPVIKLENIKIVEHPNDLIDIFSPGGQRKISIRKPKIPIKSTGKEKMSELQSLRKQIMSMTVVPDFGYEKSGMEFWEDVGGWKLFYDYVKKEPKYQKLTNYIQNKNEQSKSER